MDSITTLIKISALHVIMLLDAVYAQMAKLVMPAKAIISTIQQIKHAHYALINILSQIVMLAMIKIVLDARTTIS